MSDIVNVPLNEITIDHNFNCRGPITVASCERLIEGIKKDGLLSPITLMRTPNGNKPYKIIVGHRRFMSIQHLGWPTIPAYIREPMSEVDQHNLNLEENLNRQDLTIEQEANALKFYFSRSYDDVSISHMIGKNITWVAARRRLTELPNNETVMEMAGNGFINQKQIMDLWKYRNEPEKYIELVRALRDRGLGARDSTLKDLLKKKETKTTAKTRSKKDVYAVMEYLRRLHISADPETYLAISALSSPQGNSLHTRLLAWAVGNATTGELITDLEHYSDALNVTAPDLMEVFE